MGNMSGPVDQLDARLIGLLRDEPRIGLMEVSRRLRVARGTVQARLAKLTERGVIRGFGPELDPHRMGYPLMAFVFLQITQGRLQEAVDVLGDVPEVLEATATSGPSDLLCRIVARDTEHLQNIVNRLLSNPAIRRSTSYIALSEQIPYRTGPLLTSAADQATSSASGPIKAGGATTIPAGSTSRG
jgi:DNA-binding Lrp family transcriptional regulator